jgi:hypothetical protein
VGTAAEAAATSLRAWSARPGLSSAARSIASAAAARCQARRSGWSCRPSASWRCAAARCAKGPHKQHDPLGVQAAAGEGQGVKRAAVEPLGVVGDHEHRGTFRKIRQQGEHGDPGQQRVRSNRVRSKAERPQQGLRLPAGKAGGSRQHRPQELMQPGERELRLRFPPGDRQHPHARRPRPPGCVRQEHGLAHARLTGNEQDLACPRDRLHEATQPRKPGFPANNATGLLRRKFTRA